MILEAEKGVLSALINIENWGQTLPFKLTEYDFFDKGNQLLAKVVLKLLDEGQTSLSKEIIISTAKDMGLTQFGSYTNSGDSIDALNELQPSKEEALLFLKQVKKESLRFRAVDELAKLKNYIQNTSDPLKDMLNKCEDTILNITTSAEHRENHLVNLMEDIDTFVDMMGDNPGNYGLDIGLQNWAERVGGVSNGKVHMFIATFKTGKSTIGQRAALLLAKNIPILIVDTEMTAAEQKERIFCQLIKMPYDVFKFKPWKIPGTPEYNQWFHIIQQGKKEAKKLKITYLEAYNKSVTDMVPSMRRWAIQNNVISNDKNPKGLIIYDYVKLVNQEEVAKLAEYQRLGLDVGLLKSFANKYHLPIITFGQTNREDDSTVKCLGASKRIGDLVDSLTLFKEKTPEILMQDPVGTHLLRVFATRSGSGTKQGEHINIIFDKSIGHMQELGTYTPTNLPPILKKKPVKDFSATVDELIESDDDDDNPIY